MEVIQRTQENAASKGSEAALDELVSPAQFGLRRLLLDEPPDRVAGRLPEDRDGAGRAEGLLGRRVVVGRTADRLDDELDGLRTLDEPDDRVGLRTLEEEPDDRVGLRTLEDEPDDRVGLRTLEEEPDDRVGLRTLEEEPAERVGLGELRTDPLRLLVDGRAVGRGVDGDLRCNCGRAVDRELPDGRGVARRSGWAGRAVALRRSGAACVTGRRVVTRLRLPVVMLRGSGCVRRVGLGTARGRAVVALSALPVTRRRGVACTV